MKKIISLLLVVIITALSGLLVSCDVDEPIDLDDTKGKESEAIEEPVREADTVSVVELGVEFLPENAVDVFNTLKDFVNDKMTVYCMDYSLTDMGHIIQKAATNGSYLSIDQGSGLTEMYVLGAVGYLKTPDVDGFVATSDSETVASIKATFDEMEMFKKMCFDEEIVTGSISSVSDSALGGVKVTFTDVEDPNNVYTIETDSKEHWRTLNGEIVGSGITRIKITVVGIEDGRSLLMSCEFTNINGDLVLSAPI